MSALESISFRNMAVLAALSGGLCMGVREVEATLIVSDDFNLTTPVGSPETLPLNGRTPNLANSPLGSWVQVDGYEWAKPKLQNANPGFAWLNPAKYNGAVNTSVNSTGFAIPINSSGGYTKPEQISISADLWPDLPADVAYTTLSLGFYSSGLTLNANNVLYNGISNFTGLQLDHAGGLRLVVNGTPVGDTIAFGGTYDANAYHKLSYTIDTTAHTISDVSLEGGSATYNFSTNAFTDAATMWAGVGQSVAPNANGGGVNFVVQSVPEPTAIAMAAGCFGLLLSRRNRRA